MRIMRDAALGLGLVVVAVAIAAAIIAVVLGIVLGRDPLLVLSGLHAQTAPGVAAGS